MGREMTPNSVNLGFSRAKEHRDQLIKQIISASNGWKEEN